ncbi:type IIL restriction-modification enzyme MmeI, partial [uncultured Bacteroides sp.]|uniref:type IIL restriction-modification enzyme MmeI n=1 Tax=uncultured Bacteroides sp. TaxID=162156 RepID=UPI0032209689
MYLNLSSYKPSQMRSALISLFHVLNTPLDARDPYLDEDLKAFPYVNGGLFNDEEYIIPQLNGEISDILLEQCSRGFKWADISPTIFGAIVEDTMNPETRDINCPHYTSIENIHKVIDALFLNELKADLA